MGMGKTVVCAALILANPSTQPPPAASAWHDHQARTAFAARSAGKKTDWQQPPDKVYTWVHGPVVRKHRYNCPLHFQSQYEQCPVHQLPAAHPGPCVCRADAKVDWAIDRNAPTPNNSAHAAWTRPPTVAYKATIVITPNALLGRAAIRAP